MTKKGCSGMCATGGCGGKCSGNCACSNTSPSKTSDAIDTNSMTQNILKNLDTQKNIHTKNKKSVTFHVIVFGCQMNYSDAARIKSVLMNSGLEYVTTIEEADIVIFDTCSVRQKSEDKVTGKLKEIPAGKKIRITGCMVQHNMRNSKISSAKKRKKVKGLMGLGNFVGTVSTKTPLVLGWENHEITDKLPEGADPENIVYVNNAFNPMFFNFQKNNPAIELLFRIDDTGFLPLMLERLGYEVQPDVEVTNEYTGILPQGTNQLMQENSKTAFVPISTGCSQFCAYCIVPFARGLEKNLAIEDIVREAKHHIDNGIEEITLLGQIVNKHPDFVEICRQILALPGNLKRLRYTSPYPTYYSDELLALHEKEERMAPHIHMPLQSGSSPILKKMFRGYTADQFKGFVDKIRALDRKISITTDIIVGFTDETEEDFQLSLDMVDYAQFDMVYIGKYSVRPGTLAARKYEDTVNAATKHDRWDRLNEKLKVISAANNQKEIGTQKLMMVNRIEENWFGGYADNMKNVIVRLDSSTVESAQDTSRVFNNAPKGKKGGLTHIYVGDKRIALGDFVLVQIVDSEAFKLHGELV